MKKIFHYKNYNSILIFLKKFNLKSFEDASKINLYLEYFDLKIYLKKIKEDFLKKIEKPFLRTVSKKELKPFDYELSDLCRLHWTILTRKAINTLEFGSGFSTVFMADANFILDHFFSKDVTEMRYEKKFHVYSVEESKKYLKITQKRLPVYLKKYVTIVFSKIDIVEYNGRYASRYRNLPNISPDLIYLDAPSLYFSKNKYKGFSFNHIHRVPMSADLLFIEYFLQPGTAIIVDGRTANSRFLKDHFKRYWKYRHDYSSDSHYFELSDSPWGIYNYNKLRFSKSSIKFI
jgi:hypothetical protein